MKSWKEESGTPTPTASSNGKISVKSHFTINSNSGKVSSQSMTSGHSSVLLSDMMFSM